MATSTGTVILGIETSCDETSAAVVRGGREVLSNVIHSQIDLHQRYGGVVPELASRRHITTIIPAIDLALEQAGVTRDDIDAIAVTEGPGLAGALLVGVNVAKTLALTWGLPGGAGQSSRRPYLRQLVVAAWRGSGSAARLPAGVPDRVGRAHGARLHAWTRGV